MFITGTDMATAQSHLICSDIERSKSRSRSFKMHVSTNSHIEPYISVKH